MQNKNIILYWIAYSERIDSGQKETTIILKTVSFLSCIRNFGFGIADCGTYEEAKKISKTNLLHHINFKNNLYEGKTQFIEISFAYVCTLHVNGYSKEVSLYFKEC